MKLRFRFALCLGLSWVFTHVISICGGPLQAQDPAPKIVTRLFFQDDQAGTIRWADLKLNRGELSLSDVQEIPGFPKLDGEQQRLVQMEAAEGFLLVGVRDDNDGETGSGWVLMETGVKQEEHGDHSHWLYQKAPCVLASVIDTKQGNPAHLYCYDNVFFLANDRKNGYTRLSVKSLPPNADATAIQQRAIFHPGGGSHITLAASKGWGYSSWIDREGQKKGQVDITQLKDHGQPEIALSFALPHGGIHGATAAADKVFFAPSDGLCWVQALTEPPAKDQKIAVHHLSLGKAGDQPRRTGGFTTFGDHVLFVTGAGPAAHLGLLDASQAEPKVTLLSLPMAEGNRPAGLEVVRPRRGSPLAFLFHDHPVDVTAPNLLSLVELDPNGDGAFTDAKLIEGPLEVGQSLLEGHGGHHALTFDGDRRRAIFTNPGDGTLSVLLLDQRQVANTFRVGGTPSKIIAVGGRASDH